MKGLRLFLAGTISSLFLIACTNQGIEGGQVGVYVDKPILFGHGGVREEVESTGRVITWITTNVRQVSIKPETITVHIDDMMTANKVPLDFDIAVTIQIRGPKDASYLIREFNSGPLGAFSNFIMPGADADHGAIKNPSGEFMSYLRDKIRHYHMDEFMIGLTADGHVSSAARDTEEGLREYINKFLESRKVPVMVTNIALGRANPPLEVSSALSRTAEQVQLKTTEEARKQAQESRKAAENASAIADKAYKEGLGLTNEQWLKKSELDTVLKVCGSATKDLHDSEGGKNGCTFVYGQALPTIALH